MKTSLKNIHCVLENNPAWAASPLPYEDGTDSPVYSVVDWEPLLTQYRKGDKQVLQLLCSQSRPLVDRISRNPYYATALGRDEAYSIAAMSMVNFWNRTDLTENPKNLPGQLYHAMECDLKNQMDRQNTRRRREIHHKTDGGAEGADDEWQDPLAVNRNEPEELVLQTEWNRNVRDCLQYLGKKERQVIQGFFFRHLSVTEIANEMNCSPDSVTSAKRHALKKLRSIFTEQKIV